MSQEVVARLGKEEDAPAATVNYNFGDNLDEAIGLFGDEAIFSRFRSASVVDLQALIRRHLSGEKPKSQDEIQALADEWKPGIGTRVKRSPKDKALDALAALTPEDRATLLESL